MRKPLGKGDGAVGDQEGAQGDGKNKRGFGWSELELRCAHCLGLVNRDPALCRGRAEDSVFPLKGGCVLDGLPHDGGDGGNLGLRVTVAGENDGNLQSGKGYRPPPTLIERS